MPYTCLQPRMLTAPVWAFLSSVLFWLVRALCDIVVRCVAWTMQLCAYMYVTFSTLYVPSLSTYLRLLRYFYGVPTFRRIREYLVCISIVSLLVCMYNLQSTRMMCLFCVSHFAPSYFSHNFKLAKLCRGRNPP
jgi:hypothetical protein